MAYENGVGEEGWGGEVRERAASRKEVQPPETSIPTLAGGYPISIFFIMGNEFCERFSFYGLKAILPLYFRDFLRFENEDVGTALVHSFVFSCYLFSVFGGFLADSFFGKYAVIVALSMVYCVGASITSVTAIPGVTGTPPHWWGALIGLSLTAIGTGGIKSCVSGFVGDQFVKGQEKLLDNVFAIFYFFINLGSFCSTVATPLLREEYVHGGHLCSSTTDIFILFSSSYSCYIQVYIYVCTYAHIYVYSPVRALVHVYVPVHFHVLVMLFLFLCFFIFVPLSVNCGFQCLITILSTCFPMNSDSAMQ